MMGEREQASKQPCQAQVHSSCKLWTQPSMEQLAWITAATLNARLSFSSIWESGQGLAIYLDTIGGAAENIYCQSETPQPRPISGNCRRENDTIIQCSQKPHRGDIAVHALHPSFRADVLPQKNEPVYPIRAIRKINSYP